MFLDNIIEESISFQKEVCKWQDDEQVYKMLIISKSEEKKIFSKAKEKSMTKCWTINKDLFVKLKLLEKKVFIINLVGKKCN